MNFRDLIKEDIEVRVQSGKENGVFLLLYKNARVDMNLLDETVGGENWQNKFYDCCGGLFCSLGININHGTDKDPCWIWKDDSGVEGTTGEIKSTASDARKRAGFAWGIGRELYTSPRIWVSNKDCKIVSYEKNGRKYYTSYDNFEVEKIKIEDKKIVGLAIRNVTQNKRCFVWQAQ